MNVKVDVKIFDDETAKPFLDEHGRPLTCSMEMSNTRGIRWSEVQESARLMIGVICKYYGQDKPIRFNIEYDLTDDNGLSQHIGEMRRFDPTTGREWERESCFNCSNFSTSHCGGSNNCQWKPKRGVIEYTDDESRCSECGQLVYSNTRVCPNCLARL